MTDQQPMATKEIIAKAIEDNEYERSELGDPAHEENYAGMHGYHYYDWMSDWGAYGADLVIHRLKKAGFIIRRDDDTVTEPQRLCG